MSLVDQARVTRVRLDIPVHDREFRQAFRDDLHGRFHVSTMTQDTPNLTARGVYVSSCVSVRQLLPKWGAG